LANALCAGRTLTCDAQLEQKIAALSPQEVVAGLRRRLDWNKMKVVKAGDLAGRHPLLPASRFPIGRDRIEGRGANKYWTISQRQRQTSVVLTL
jgi:hypothetical protein